jgi:hypothetical protein
MLSLEFPPGVPKFEICMYDHIDSLLKKKGGFWGRSCFSALGAIPPHLKIHPGLKKLFTSPDRPTYRGSADTKFPADLYT